MRVLFIRVKITVLKGHFQWKHFVSYKKQNIAKLNIKEQRRLDIHFKNNFLPGMLLDMLNFSLFGTKYTSYCIPHCLRHKQDPESGHSLTALAHIHAGYIRTFQN